MPRATASQEPGDKVGLRTCPDGFVVLKRLTFGQKLQRQQQATKVSMELKRGKRDSKADLDMLQRQSTYFDFSMCVVDHNLDDENGQRLNLSSPVDVDRLDPRIGEEIANLIDDLNNFEVDEAEGNSSTVSGRQ